MVTAGYQGIQKRHQNSQIIEIEYRFRNMYYKSNLQVTFNFRLKTILDYNVLMVQQVY